MRWHDLVWIRSIFIVLKRLTLTFVEDTIFEECFGLVNRTPQIHDLKYCLFIGHVRFSLLDDVVENEEYAYGANHFSNEKLFSN